jgi:4-hydroxythreonine-4-phosphate dehydrogenase
MQFRPRIAITMGDPGGIGPRVIARALANAFARRNIEIVIFGHAETLQAAAELEGVRLPVVKVASVDEYDSMVCGEPIERMLGIVEVIAPDDGKFARGAVDAANGRAALTWIEAAVRSCLAGKTHALVTGPISKEAIRLAGSDFPGHTELLAAMSGNCEVRMMLTGGHLNVVLETVHMALANVARNIERGHLVRSLEIINSWSERTVGALPRIGVCGLNPHAGEHGQFGREELEVIAPAVAEARGRGLNVSGPWPADTIFHRARNGEFDFVLAMYHDQGLVALKTVAFDTGVNVTLGLPFVRTSPDHGTAFDRAWVPSAPVSSRSFEQAVRLAAKWVRRAQR